MASVEWSSTMSDKDYDTLLDGAVKSALKKAGSILQEAAMLNAPVLTGRLAGSITYKTKKARSNVRSPAKSGDAVSRPEHEWTLHVGSNVDYAQHIEYGTVKMAAQPYLRPALQNNKFRIVKEFSKWVSRFLKGEYRRFLKRGE